MVLLTMTPTMVTAIEEYLQIVTARDKSNNDDDDGDDDHDVLANEPSLENPSVGNPISHGQVVDIFTTIRQHRSTLEIDMQDGGKSYDDRVFQLEQLLRGSKVYVPPAGSKPESEGYKNLMNNLRRQEEERAYEKMISRPSRAKAYQPHDPQTSNSSTDKEDEMTYADVNRQMALILNVIISIVACSYAIWIVSRHWTTPYRLALSLGGTVLVAIAEVVVYAGYVGKLKEAKERGKNQIETKEIINTWVIGGRSDGNARNDLSKGNVDNGATEERPNGKVVTPINGNEISGSQDPVLLENDLKEDQRSSGVSRPGPLPTPRRGGT